MNKDDLITKIRELLNTSTISLHHKMMVKILMPVMEIGVLEQIFSTLQNEKEKLANLRERKKSLQKKYQALLAKFHKNKA
ncbi:hypothetical protein HYW82_00615 [Candidatus Peregrinibacteria bacterium]|nr:hypothetical protein [Candidatus Peregrinibacteria bacterium]